MLFKKLGDHDCHLSPEDGCECQNLTINKYTVKRYTEGELFIEMEIDQDKRVIDVNTNLPYHKQKEDWLFMARAIRAIFE